MKTSLILLYSKGADLAIFDQLSPNLDQIFLEQTRDDLIKFSTKGYRTLCFAMRVLDSAYYEAWAAKYESTILKKCGGGSISDDTSVIECDHLLMDIE
jgi:phospholipid-transporting ATPase